MKTIYISIILFISTFMYSQPGTLDLTFGINGKVLTELAEYSTTVTSILRQSSGRIILSGRRLLDGKRDAVAVGYLPNGQIDSEFGYNGIFYFEEADMNFISYGAAIDKDENIYLGGTASDTTGNYGFILKLEKNGSIDSTFAENGVWTSNTNKTILQLHITDNEKILLGGRESSDDLFQNFAIVQCLDLNGVINMNFGDNGVAKTEVSGSYNPYFLKTNSNQEIFIGGQNNFSNSNIQIIKYKPNGLPDSTFSNNGVLLENTPTQDVPGDLVIQNDGKIVLVGRSYTSDIWDSDFLLARYNSDGTLDLDFGTGGKVFTELTNTNSRANSVSLQEDGKIIICGATGSSGEQDYAIVRYDTQGKLDTTFNGSGIVVTDFGLNDMIFSSTILEDGKLLCSGRGWNADNKSIISMAQYYTNNASSIFSHSELIEEIKLFPNPTEQHLSINLNLKDANNVSVRLLNSSGAIIESLSENQKLSSGHNILHFELNQNVESGFYFIQIELKSGLINKKFVVKT